MISRIHYEVRRGAAIVTTKDDAKTALAFAEAHSNPPGQLKVHAVERREWEVTEAPAEPIQFAAAKAKRGAV